MLYFYLRFHHLSKNINIYYSFVIALKKWYIRLWCYTRISVSLFFVFCRPALEVKIIDRLPGGFRASYFRISYSYFPSVTGGFCVLSLNQRSEILRLDSILYFMLISIFVGREREREWLSKSFNTIVVCTLRNLTLKHFIYVHIFTNINRYQVGGLATHYQFLSINIFNYHAMRGLANSFSFHLASF